MPRVNVTLIADDLNASPLGWLTDGTNTTAGNNVRAGLDIDFSDGIDSNVTGANRVFNFDYNPAPGLAGATGSTDPKDANYRNGIVTNLFFWTNRYHDRLYNLGFTEAARNFQATNIFNGTNRGGAANDPVLAECQDYSGTNNAGFAGEDVPDIRSGFAACGMGAGAALTGTTLFTVTESFYPSSVAGAITFSDSLGNNNGVAEPGEDLVFTIPLTNRLTAADNNVTARLNNYGASYGTLAAGASASQTFAYHVPATTAPGTLLQIPFTVSSANVTVTVPVPVRVGTPTANVTFAENFDGVTAPALPPGWTQTGTVTNSTWKTVATPVIDNGNCAFAADVASTSDSSLVSPVIAVGSAANQQLSFKHRYAFQYTGSTGYDAGVLEIKIGAGSFTDIITAGGSFVQGGYGFNIGSAATGSPLIGRRAWGDTIGATTSTVTVNLPPAAANQNVQFRWREGCNSSTVSTGWYVDSVQVFSTSYASATIDSDGDGIPDGYELAHGLNPSDPSDAARDSDGDGLTNLQEYTAGTDPMVAGATCKFLPSRGIISRARPRFPSPPSTASSTAWSSTPTS